MTAHGSKGMEFDYVFLPFASDEAWIGRARGASFILPHKKASDSDMRDVRRLFYVALTRARRHVTVLSSLEESDGKELAPLRFLSELDPKTVSAVHAVRLEAPAKHPSGMEAAGEAELASLAKKVLLDSGISPTALNHFLECPNKYLYESILKMPQAPSAAAEKGTAMHAAISAVWMEEERTPENIERLLTETASRSVDDSFLPLSEKEAVKAKLTADAPAVAQALLSHFGTAGTIYTEKWMRVMYGHVYEGAHLAIPLHGRLDTLIDKGEQVEVFDYKTRQGMSEAEIKGETKTSDGSYFRQLCFYKLLVESDRRFRGRKASYSLAFVSPDKKGRCPIVTLPVSSDDVKALESNIRALVDAVMSSEVARSSCGKHECEYCAWRSVVSRD